MSVRTLDDLEKEIRRLRRLVSRRLWELERELEELRTLACSRVTSAFFEEPLEPLHSVYETPREYVIVVDMPAADSSTINVLVFEDMIEVRAQMRKELTIEYPSFVTTSEEFTYVKRILLPIDADTGAMSYRYERGRLIIAIPRRPGRRIA